MVKSEKKITIEVSSRTIIITLVCIIGFWLFYYLRDIIFGFFISLILMGAINPTVEKLERKGFSRLLAIVLVYFVALVFFALALVIVLPPLIQQSSELIRTLPVLVEKVRFLGVSPDLISDQINQLGSIPGQIIKLILTVFSNLFSIFVILVITFYLLLEHKNLDRHLFHLLGKEGEKRGRAFIKKLERRLGGWVRAEIALMSFVGLLSYIGFVILGLDFALSLALLAAILELVPNIGPVIAAIPATLFGFLISPLTGIATLSWCFIVQQIENNFLVPKVMKSAVDVNPIITLLSLAVGFRLAGVAGALLAIPTFIVIELIITEFFLSKAPTNSINRFG